MRLLPDVTLNDHRISLQDPYTIDGRLPINIEIPRHHAISHNSQIERIITLDNGRNIVLSISNYFFGFGNEHNYIDEMGNEINDLPRNIENLFLKIERQVAGMGNPNYYTALLTRLVRQNRVRSYSELMNHLSFREALLTQNELREVIDNVASTNDQLSILGETAPSSITFTNEAVASINEAHERPRTLSEYFRVREERVSSNSESSWYDLLRSATSATRTASSSLSNTPGTPIKKYIHEYNYKPKYIKHYMPGEDPTTTLLLGAEIEVGDNPYGITDKKEGHVKKCIQIMNGSDSDEETLIYSTADSTVQIELDTMPCSLAFHKEKMNYRRLFKYLDKEGYKGHDCSTAGLHIHANRSYLGKSKLVQQLTISKILYLLEKFNDEICVIARRGNSYSRFMGSGKDEDSVIDLYWKYDRTKHVALNLTHTDTIEFRCFKSTLKYETFILTLEFVSKIIDFAKAINIEEIELVKWKNLLNTFSPELKDYYFKRKELEKKKAREEQLNRTITENNNFREQLQGTSTCSSANYNGYVNFRLINADMDSSLELSNLGSVESTSETRIDEFKKQIKNMKKQIKNSRNGLERIRLQRELNELQRELSELKRWIRLRHN